ncbi:TonB-dependent receptor [Novosphingobium sp. MMS21-SN21R]|uniref:TonB-dependent receptor n=1 Tax=Novosphingobium sp. MMS21-SN21R TaxID=2969298 RepID=UPI0028877A88|nr:TonB-dependent receptor [Novosphingobium sp. MMS21-SN21R]MDT0510109.1 TonB-dependent receptor [Novosphingobium sp. MMS21-SN21R]
MKTNSRLKAGLVLTTMLASMPGVAFAQATAPAEGDVATAEIVVTAQRRSESIQKVPLSLTAVTGAELRDRAISDLAGVAAAAPSLQIGSDASFSVRGVGTLAFAGTIDSSVALAVDEVNMGRPALGTPLLMDLQRVEVLNGPQGLLFGKNASAGLLNVVTARPELGVFGGSTELEFSSRDTPGANRSAPGIIAKQVLNIPVSANSALRLNVLYGYQESPVTNIGTVAAGNRFDSNRRNFQIKGKYLAEFSDSFSLYVIGDYNRATGAGSFFDATWREFGTGSAARPVYAQVGGVAGPDNFLYAGDGAMYRDIDTGGAQATLKYVTGSGLEISNLFAWRFYDVEQSLDIDRLQTNLVNVNYTKSNYNQYSNELRVALPSGNRLGGQVGLYYFQSKLNQEGEIFGNQGLPSFVLPSFPFCVGATAVPGAFPPTCSVRNDYFIGRDAKYTMDTKSYAAFGQLTYEVVDGLQVIGGARFTHDKIDVDLFHGKRNYFISLSGPNGRYLQTSSNDNFSWKLGAQYQATPTIMFYAFHGRGYKGPGFNDTAIRNSSGVGFIPTIRPEISNTTEVGVKSSFFDRKLTLNISAFNTDFDDYQVQSLDTALQTFVVQNAAKVQARGIEVNVSARPFAGLTINGGFNILDTKFKSFPGAQCYLGQAVASCAVNNTFDATGLRLPISPKFTSTVQATYELPVSGTTVPYIQGNWYHRSSVNYILNGAPGGAFGAVDTFGFSLGVKVGDKMQFSLFCKNCTNEHIPQSIGIDPGDLAGRPAALSYTQVFGLDAVRSVGGTLTIRY